MGLYPSAKSCDSGQPEQPTLIKSIVEKGEIAVISTFSFSHNVFKKSFHGDDELGIVQ